MNNASKDPHDINDLGSRLRLMRIEKENDKLSQNFNKNASTNALSLAFRVGIELVSALMIGLGIGWLLDSWLTTRPWLMIVFTIFGGAAGILNVYRQAAGFGYTVGYINPNNSDPSVKPRSKVDKSKE